MKKSVYQIINEQVRGKVDNTPVLSVDDSRSVFQIVNEGISEINVLISESAMSLSDMNEDLISAVLMNESAQAEALNEGVMKNVGEGIRKFFKMIKDFISRIIEKIGLMINAHRKNGAQLVATYGSRVKGASTEGIEIKGFKYLTDKVKGWVTNGDTSTTSDIQSKVDGLDATLATFMGKEKVTKEMEINDLNKALSNATSEFVKEELDKIKEDSSDFQDTMKAIIQKATGESVNSKSISEAQQELMKAARDGKTEKTVIKAKDYNMDAIMKDLTAGIELTAIQRALEGFKKNVEDMQRSFEKDLKEMESSKDTSNDGVAAAKARYFISNKVSYLNAAKDYLSKIYNVNNAINAVVIKIVEEDYKQKVQLFIAVAKKAKLTKQNNSVEEIDEMDMIEFDM